ncbi:MAG: HAD family hydrolase [Oscillospiraceae bacterium]|nr:HAD family hydrolase [Oscillospiraceae bacterium]
MIRALLFDLGGTLHTVRQNDASRMEFCSHVIDILGRNGIRADISPAALDAMLAVNGEEYKHFGEQSLTELPASEIWSRYYLRELGISAGQLAPVAEELSFLYDSERVESIPRPFLKETLEELHRMGVRLGVISNIISTTFVPYCLRKYGIAQYMECVVMSSAAGIRKPDPRIFREAMDKMGLTAPETGYVGDTISRDVLGSRRAGLGLCVRIENPSIAHRDAAFQGPDAPQADHVIKELPELIPIMKRINGQ